MRSTFIVMLFIFTQLAFAQSKVAVVKMLRGDASVVENGKTGKLATEQWVPAGAVVKTGDKSFVRLVFIDKSQMNIGPNSEMKIEQFGGGDAGVIDLVKGKIRSQVSKDYLQQKDKDKSKMFIKTPNAVMGIRGTDFLISTNGVNSSAVLFEGEVVFNKVENAASREINTNNLEAAVDRGVRIFPGEFSVVEANRPNPTVPAVLNVQQIETLEKNQDFSKDRSPSDQGSQTTAKSVVPPGLSGTSVANQAGALDKELKQAGVEVGASNQADKVGIEAAKGFEQNGQLKPTNGSYLHVDTGVVIAPPKDSAYDSNSNTFVPSGSAGSVAADGNYQPPSNVTITDSGKILASSGGQMIQIQPASVVMGSSATLGDVMKIVTTTPNLNTITTLTAGVATINPTTILPPPPPAGSTFKEAPTLCSTCGGAIPGSATQLNNKTPVKIDVTVGP
ncbi:MAG: FecR family protein [Bacteriovoracaceae bacterium]|nr:FecR family protein [Bacteriovoracaceae bacterium]